MGKSKINRAQPRHVTKENSPIGGLSTRADNAQPYFNTAFTFLLSEGKTSSSNQGFFFNQILFLGLGCGKGIALGQ